MALALFTIRMSAMDRRSGAEKLVVSAQTAYRYFKQLTAAG